MQGMRWKGEGVMVDMSLRIETPTNHGCNLCISHVT
jgi:hypothetical protein